MSKSIKNEQLGMNYSTASNRLVKDILFNFIVVCRQNKCFRCSEPMERHNFSIEHKVPWLHSEKPKETFFDLNNISFSHLSCNIADARKPETKCGTMYSYAKGCRCDECRAANTANARKHYSSETRKAKYMRTGH